MKPPMRERTEFERIPVYDEWINGKILDVEYDLEHKRIWQGQEKIGPCVRFKFELEGCKFPHRSPWMAFVYSEKATLFKKYLTGLVKDAQTDLDFDLDRLKDLEIKTMWEANGEYDNLTMIRPKGDKIDASIPF